MARQWTLPGYGAINEDGEEEYTLPGYGAFQEDQPDTGVTWAGVQAGSSVQLVEILPSGAVMGDE